MDVTRLGEPLPGSRDWERHRVALVVDPRFPGGTSRAVAEEIRALGGVLGLAVFALETAMFKGRHVHPAIEEALEATGLTIAWAPSVVRADTIIFHNPSCLRFNEKLETRLSCRQAVVVMHENFLRPNGSESFDVGRCLGLVDRALVCGRRCLAPVSGHNRATAHAWIARNRPRDDWDVSPLDWLNMLDLRSSAPSRSPRDRRGRHSRPGFEKFPALDVMRRHFPAHAERCIILGSDSLMHGPDAPPPHWDLRRFGETSVETFLAEIDFFVYFTSPDWRESFGRVIAEAIAAGKIVITDEGTAGPFASAVVISDGADVDEIVRRLCADPEEYVRLVEAAQAQLAQFHPTNVVPRILDQIDRLSRAHHALG